MDKSIVGEFLEKNQSKAETTRRVRILRDFCNWRLYEMGGKPADKELVARYSETILAKQDPRFGQTDSRFLAELSLDFLNMFKAENLAAKIAQLEESVNKAEVVTVYLAIDLPEQETDRLGEWFKQNVGPACLYDLQYREGLIGGVAIAYKGMLKDYSLKARIEAEKKQILATLTDFRK